MHRGLADSRGAHRAPLKQRTRANVTHVTRAEDLCRNQTSPFLADDIASARPALMTSFRVSRSTTVAGRASRAGEIPRRYLRGEHARSARTVDRRELVISLFSKGRRGRRAPRGAMLGGDAILGGDAMLGGDAVLGRGAMLGRDAMLGRCAMLGRGWPRSARRGDPAQVRASRARALCSSARPTRAR